MARMITRQEAANLLDVSPQTISNWVDKGILNSHNSCDGRNTMLIDRKSIEQYFDSLQDLAFMEKRVVIQKKKIAEESAALENKLKEMISTKHLFGNGISQFFLRDIFSCVINVADDLLNDRECQIINELLLGWTLNDIASKYYLSTSRIQQIVNKAIRKISTMKSWPKYHTEYKATIAENKRLIVLLESQQSRINQLESMLNINSSKESGVKSAVPGYTKLELAQLLSRRMVDENLSVRSFNCLKAADIDTVRDLICCNKTDLLKFRNFGKKSLAEIEDYLDKLHLSFGMDLDRLIDEEVEGLLEYIKDKKEQKNKVDNYDTSRYNFNN